MTRRNILISLSLALIMTACNLPSGDKNSDETATPTSPIEALIGTTTAQAEANQTTNTPEASPLPQDTPTPNIAPTPSVPQASVSVNTNCRTGPNVAYDLVGGLNVGQIAEVIGKSSATGYWIVKLSGGAVCWLFPQYVSISGNTANLPEYSIPPTPTPSATPNPTPTTPPALPAAPTNFSANGVTCQFVSTPFIHNKLHLTLAWDDVATNETGYRIYEDGTQLIALAPDTISYAVDSSLGAIILIGNPPPSHTYTIEAYNAVGVSAPQSVTVQCP